MEPAIWKQADDVLYRRLPGAVLVLADGPDDPVLLDGTAAAIWDLLAHPRSASDVVAELASTYEVAAGIVEASVIPALEKLRSARLIRPAQR